MGINKMKCGLSAAALAILVVTGGLGGCTTTGSIDAGLSDETAEKIMPGDNAKIEYTCYFADGRMAVTTDKEIAEFSSTERADIFVTPKDPGPVQVTVGSEEVERIDGMQWAENFDTAIAAYLARDIEGLAYGQKERIKITAHPQESITESERYLKFYRRTVKERVQKSNVTPQFTSLYGDNIQPGDIVDIVEFPGMAFEMLEKDGDEMLTSIILKTKGGVLVDDAWGYRRFSYIDDEKYEIVYETEVGHIGRAGRLVGRVVEIHDDYFLIDWGIPFGGETLTCDVVVQKD